MRVNADDQATAVRQARLDCGARERVGGARGIRQRARPHDPHASRGSRGHDPDRGASAFADAGESWLCGKRWKIVRSDASRAARWLVVFRFRAIAETGAALLAATECDAQRVGLYQRAR